MAREFCWDSRQDRKQIVSLSRRWPSGRLHVPFSRPTILRTSKIKPFPHFDLRYIIEGEQQLIGNFGPILVHLSQILVDCTIKRTRNMESQKCGTRTWQWRYRLNYVTTPSITKVRETWKLVYKRSLGWVRRFRVTVEVVNLWNNSGQGNKVQIQFILFRTALHFVCCMYVVQYPVHWNCKASKWIFFLSLHYGYSPLCFMP